MEPIRNHQHCNLVCGTLLCANLKVLVYMCNSAIDFRGMDCHRLDTNSTQACTLEICFEACIGEIGGSGQKNLLGRGTSIITEREDYT